jgi:Putative DNA-binding domain
MARKSFSTLEDIQSIVSERIPEGVNLEYKASTVLIKNNQDALCKAVSALANSAGGTLIIGVETKDSVPIRVDNGTPGPSKRDWIYQVLNVGTFPAVEALEVREFNTPTGAIYVLDVMPSSQAPHQSKDHKYYKRRGPHSEVMEHYEIEDVRARPKRPLMPLRSDLETRSTLAYLSLMNGHETEAITNLTCKIDANFVLDRDRDYLAPLKDRGLRALWPRFELHFLIGSIPELTKTPEPEITFRFNYTFQEKIMAQSVVFHLADLNMAMIIQSPVERELEKLGKKLDQVTNQLEKLHRSADMLTKGVDGTGIRVSQRTIRGLKNVPQLYDPREFDADGYRIIADIPLQASYDLSRLFRYLDHSEAKQQYSQMSDEVRAQFEKHFAVPFSNDSD